MEIQPDGMWIQPSVSGRYRSSKSASKISILEAQLFYLRIRLRAQLHLGFSIWTDDQLHIKRLFPCFDLTLPHADQLLGRVSQLRKVIWLLFSPLKILPNGGCKFWQHRFGYLRSYFVDIVAAAVRQHDNC